MNDKSKFTSKFASIEADLDDIIGNVEMLKNGRVPSENIQRALDNTSQLLARLKTNISELRSIAD